jgi:hypothetical protein
MIQRKKMSSIGQKECLAIFNKNQRCNNICRCKPPEDLGIDVRCKMDFKEL